MMNRGRFYVIEGIDGAGKTTISARLVAYLRSSGRQAVLVREPGGTPLGEAVRDAIALATIDSAKELLFWAARAELIHTVILPALSAGKDVVTDRFLPSGYAYPRVDGTSFIGLMRTVCPIETWNTDLAGDLVILDIRYEVHVRRLKDRGEKPLTEQEFNAVRERYKTGAKCVINANGTPDLTFSRLLEALWQSISQQ